MSAITQRERTVKELVLETCWEYLRSNFSKFSDANKIKVALALAQKSLPQETIGSLQVTQMPAITKGSEPLEYNIGNPTITTDS